MTKSQKVIFSTLLAGGSIAHLGASGVRLRDEKFNPISKVGLRTFSLLKDVIKKNKKGAWVISLSGVRRLRKNSWAYQQYKLSLKNKKNGKL